MSTGARWRLHGSFWPALALLAAALAVFEFTPLDLAVQDRLFDFGRGKWIVDGAAAGPRLLFYTGPKAALILFGGTALLVTLAPRHWRERLGIDAYRRRGCVVLFLTLALVPSLVGWLKSATNVFCPAETRRYGGDVPYVRVFERFPGNDRPARVGRCFPAGHASGGFALVGLVALARTRRAQILGLSIAAATGLWMGAYQMAKGAHYLSHTVVTALLAWLVFLLIDRWTPAPVASASAGKYRRPGSRQACAPRRGITRVAEPSTNSVPEPPERELSSRTTDSEPPPVTRPPEITGRGRAGKTRPAGRESGPRADRGRSPDG